MFVVRQEQVIRTYDAEKILAPVTPPTTVKPQDNKINISKTTGEMLKIRPKPRTHIAFLKVHKAASSTVQNILYRFGLGHNLSFVLPEQWHYISKEADFYVKLLPALDKSGKYDIICNHVVFNERKFRSLMYDDAFYLAIVRNPLQRFVSAAYYYRYVYNHTYFLNMGHTTFLHDLITNPMKYEPNYQDSKTFSRLAFDFGLKASSVKEVMSLDDSTKNKFVLQLLERFHFVMLVEKFDESLVMMKRYLNWTIKDILYIKQNEFHNANESSGIVIQNVTQQDEAKFKLTNHLDYLIYDKFVERFNVMAAKEINLEAEVKEFKHTLEIVEAFCTIDIMATMRRYVMFSETKFNAAFRVSRYDCQLMMKSELAFNDELKTSHMYNLEHTNNDTQYHK